MVSKMNPICPKCGRYMISNIYWSVGKPYIDYVCSYCGYTKERGYTITNYTISTKPVATNRTNKEVGEVSQGNCKNSYPYAMALKRCFDRVVLKNSKLAYSGVYSDSEADEFAERIEDPETQVEAKERIIERETWRGKVLELAHEKNIGFKELAADYNLTSNTTAEEFKKVYEDLRDEKPIK